MIVKALDATESESVNLDLSWLTTYITEVNGPLDDVYENLILPIEAQAEPPLARHRTILKFWMTPVR